MLTRREKKTNKKTTTCQHHVGEIPALSQYTVLDDQLISVTDKATKSKTYLTYSCKEKFFQSEMNL